MNTLLAAAPSIQLRMQLTKQAVNVLYWLRTHKGAVTIAGLLAFAGPLTFFTGALSVMRTPTAIDLVKLGLWWMLYGATLWCLLLVTGYSCERLARHFPRYIRSGIWLMAACLAAAVTNIVTAERASILIEQGLVHSAWTMHLHGFMFSLIVALLYFAHLRRSRGHEQAAARLAAAQTAQRQARRRTVQARVLEMQARIDPQLLFEMLDTVRRLYEHDAVRAERFLDELITFLRAALPRMRTASSSLLREAELALAYVKLHALASAPELDMTIDIAVDVIHARFPPGVLLPLLSTAVDGSARPCQLNATRSNDACVLLLTLDEAPAGATVARVKSLLTELYGSSGQLEIETIAGEIHVFVKVPYELA